MCQRYWRFGTPPIRATFATIFFILLWFLMWLSLFFTCHPYISCDDNLMRLSKIHANLYRFSSLAVIVTCRFCHLPFLSLTVIVTCCFCHLPFSSLTVFVSCRFYLLRMLAQRSSEALLAVTAMYTTWRQKAESCRQRARHTSDRCKCS